jgi:hypothetical protein
MNINTNRRALYFLPLASLLFGVAHVGFEHLTGGVKSHHLLNRADLPAISNWFGLVVLPLLGGVVALRARACTSARCWAGLPFSMWAATFSALAYGAILATSFTLDAPAITNAAFFGLFAAAVALPIYRVEFTYGFVLGMTFTFGSVLPLFVAVVFGLLSLCVRWLGRLLFGLVRKARRARATVG